jgi:hypothetical protein
MKAKQTKPKKKPMTLDDFAVLIQKDLVRMATKQDIGTIREEVKESARQLRTETGIGFRNVDADLRMLTDAMVSKADLANAGRRTRQVPVCAANRQSRTRVNILESKLGMKHNRRAA